MTEKVNFILDNLDEDDYIIEDLIESFKELVIEFKTKKSPVKSVKDNVILSVQ